MDPGCGFAGIGPRDEIAVVRGRDGRVRIIAVGTLSLAAARALERAFHAALDEGASGVLVDLGAVAVSDARVVHPLLRMVDQAHSVPLEFRLAPAVESLLELTGVRHLLAAARPEPAGRAHSPPRHRRRPRRQRALRRD